MAGRSRNAVERRRQRLQAILDEGLISSQTILDRLAAEGERIGLRALQKDMKAIWPERVRRDRLLYALATCETIRQACRRAKMGWQAARRYLDDPAFVRLLEKKRARMAPEN